MPSSQLLNDSQIAAAARLYVKLPSWKLYDETLKSLNEKYPAFDLPATLLKVTTINQFYSTSLYAVMRMAEHITEVMPDSASYDDPDLVKKLGDLPVATDSETKRNFRSFASKFAHFFISQERFPILDKYSEKMVAYHLGRIPSKDPAHPYRAFFQNVEALKDQNQLKCTLAELDRYLWLAGIHLAWKENPAALINREAKKLFENETSQADLATLLPFVLDKAFKGQLL